jgi:glycosyltransferase involved in cell wall biosynthesis
VAAYQIQVQARQVSDEFHKRKFGMALRILQVIDSVNTVSGGPIEALTQLSMAMQKQGHSVDVVSLDDPEAAWVKACPLRCHAMGPAWRTYGYTARLAPWLRAHRRDYDAVIVNGLWQYHSFAVGRALRGTETPYFVFPHGMLDPWFKRRYPLKHLKKWFYWPWAEYRVLRDAAGALFTCESERRLAKQSFWLYRCNELVVNFGTAAPPDEPEEQRRAFLAEFPGLAGKRCLLFLGRIHVKKGADLAIRSFANILRSLPEPVTRDLHLVMAGPADNPYAGQMRLLAAQLGLQERITWTGMLAGRQKWGAFRCAEAFILTSHQENFGIAVAEALACGVPVLISNQVNIWHEIVAADAGYVDSDDEHGANTLLHKWLATDRDTWTQMARNATALFADKFHIGMAAQSLIAAVENVRARDAA